ncbi:signal peptidase I [bacterium]|nr:MAG: signal peptidase I [bacterium]
MFGLKWDAKGRILLIATVIGGVGAVSPVKPVVFVGPSMSPTYENREVVWATKDVGQLERGDVVVVDTPEGTIVKRIGMLPGDGYWEKWRFGKWISTVAMAKNQHKGQERFVTIPPGQVFLIGDNAIKSVDSREFGTVPMADIRLKLLDRRAPKASLALYGAVLRKNLVLRTEKPVVE